MKAFITHMRYENRDGVLVVDMYGRYENGEKLELEVYGTRPFFYTTIEDPYSVVPQNYHSLIIDVKKEGTLLIPENGISKTNKVFVKYPFDVPKIRDFFGEKGAYAFEADIPYTDRVRFDYGIKSGISVDFDASVKKCSIEQIKAIPFKTKDRRCIIDIETMDAEGFSKPDVADQPIVCLTAYDDYDDTYTIFYTGVVDNKLFADIVKSLSINEYIYKAKIKLVSCINEQVMLSQFSKYLQKTAPDVLLGWNLTNYDKEYLLTRNKVLDTGIEFEEFKYEWMDSMAEFGKLHETKMYTSLDECANEILHLSKIPRMSISEMYENNKPALLAYNLWDVVLVKMIDDKLEMTDYCWSIATSAGCDLSNVIHNGKVVDNFILHETTRLGYVLPSKNNNKATKVDKGGYVENPFSGTIENVAVFDLKSEYPSIMITLNMSPETIVPDKDAREGEYYTVPSGRRYYKSPRGLIPNFLLSLNGMRDEVKRKIANKEYSNDAEQTELRALDNMQKALKFLINSFYGVLGNEYFRLNDGRIGSDITQIGQLLRQFISDKLKEKGCTIRYGDSVTGDSIIAIKTQTKDGAVTNEVPIEQLFMRAEKTIDGKEYYFPSGLSVLSVNINNKDLRTKYCNVKYIMRHKTNKKLYSVRTNSKNNVKVTEDHSIITWDGHYPIDLKCTTPKDIQDKYLMVRDKESLDWYITQLSSCFEVYNPHDNDIYVYDLKVEDTHTFFANNILVHNTDSVMITMDGADIETYQQLEQYVNSVMIEFFNPFGATKTVAQVNFEKIYSKWFQGGAKKRYAGFVSWKGHYVEPYLEIKGYEMRRHDSSTLLKRAQIEFFKILINEGLDKAIEYAQNLVNDIWEGKHDDEILIPATYSTDDYKNIPIHYRALQYSLKNTNLKIKHGEDFKWVYIKSINGYPKTDVIALPWNSSVPDYVEIDYLLMVEKCVNPLVNIIESLGVNRNIINYHNWRSKSLETFF